MSASESCWAASLGGCRGKSKEHIVSEGLWSEPVQIQVSGYDWCKTPKSVGLSAIASHILCERHNNDLSPVDQEASLAFNTFKRAIELADGREHERHRKWKVRRNEIKAPWLLERWFLKTAINILVSAEPPGTWKGDGGPLKSPPDRLVRQAYGLETIAAPQGLYFAATSGSQATLQEIVQFAPLYDQQQQMLGAIFRFWGFPFVYTTAAGGLPALLELENARVFPDRSELKYHMRRIDWTVRGYLSNYIEFMWSLCP